MMGDIQEQTGADESASDVEGTQRKDPATGGTTRIGRGRRAPPQGKSRTDQPKEIGGREGPRSRPLW